MSRRISLIIAVCVLAIGGGAFAFTRYRASHRPQSAPVARTAAPAATDVTLPGIVEARNVVLVAAPVEGVLDSYFVEINQEVYQGQLLGRIHNPKLDELQQRAMSDLDKAQGRVTALTGEQLSARLEVSRAQADQTRAHNDVDRLQKNYDRQQGLWAAGATARLVWEKAQKDYNDAKADVEKQDAAAKQAAEHEAALSRDLETANRAVTDAREAIDRAKAAGGAAEVHSPVDGVVVARRDLQGQPVDPAIKDLLTIGTDLAALSITIQDPPGVSQVRGGQAVKVRVGNDEFAGTVREANAQSLIVDFAVSPAWKQVGQAAQVIIKN